MGEMNIFSSGTAKDYYSAGCQFLEAARRCFSDKEGYIIKDGTLIQLTAPAVVNGAFACELFIKAMLVWENTSFDFIHYLDDLFLKLSDETQKGISKFCMPKGTEKYQEEFLNLLKKYRNAFVVDRYYCQNLGWNNMSPIAILTIAENLSAITGAYIT